MKKVLSLISVLSVFSLLSCNQQQPVEVAQEPVVNEVETRPSEVAVSEGLAQASDVAFLDGEWKETGKNSHRLILIPTGEYYDAYIDSYGDINWNSVGNYFLNGSRIILRDSYGREKTGQVREDNNGVYLMFDKLVFSPADPLIYSRTGLGADDWSDQQESSWF